MSVSAAPAPHAASEWRKNWPVVLVAGAGSAFSSAHVYSLGVMMAPLERAFRWSRTEISSGLTIAAVIAVVCAPFMGMVIDKVGPRRIVLVGLCLYSAAVAALSLATRSIWVWWVLWVFLAFAHLHIKPTAWVMAVTSLFKSSRGLALGVLLSTAGVGSIVTPILTLHLVEAYGWRIAYVLLPTVWAVFVIPLVFWLFSSAKDRMRSSGNSNIHVAVELPGLALREGFRSRAFRNLACAALLMSVANMGIMVNLVPVLASLGHSAEFAVKIAGLIGVMAIVGRLAGGYLMDRMNANVVAATFAVMPAGTSILLLIAPSSILATVLGVVLIGLASGGENDSLGFLAARYFGLRNFSALFGALAGLITLGVGIGPALASYGYDVTHSYTPLLITVIPLVLLVSLLLLTAGPYPNLGALVRSTSLKSMT